MDEVLAASVAAQCGQLATSRFLWSEIAQQAENESIRKSALNHLAAIDVATQLQQLNGSLTAYRLEEGRSAKSMQDLVAVGYLRDIPVDPSGTP